MRETLLVLWLAATGCGGGGETTVDAAVPCPDTFTPVIGAGNLSFGPVEAAATWVGAYMTCVRAGTNLSTPTSQFESLALDEYANVPTQWVGVSRIDTGMEWTTVYGKPAEFLPWNVADAEPNGSGECIAMGGSADYFDFHCQSQFVFVCECRRP